MSVVDTPPAVPGGTVRAGRGPARRRIAIFRVNADGTWDELWESREDAPYDLVVEDNGDLLVATGHKGKLYRLSGDPLRASLVGRVTGQQAVQLLRTGGRTLVATSNGGALVRVDGGHADRGTYVSEVRDARSVSAWGVAVVAGDGAGGGLGDGLDAQRQHVDARRGVEPVECAPTRTPTGSPIASPSARYLQWRVQSGRQGRGTGGDLDRRRLPAAQPAADGERPGRPSAGRGLPEAVLDRRNRDCRLPVGRARAAPRQPGPAAAGDRHADAWPAHLPERAADAGLEGRRRQRRRPHVRRGLPPRGRQRLDHAGQRPSTTRSTSGTPPRCPAAPTWCESLPATRRHKPRAAYWSASWSRRSSRWTTRRRRSRAGPVGKDAGRVTVTIEVRDDQSAVSRVEYSLDGGAWLPAYPVDGLFDGRRESVALRLEGRGVGQDTGRSGHRCAAQRRQFDGDTAVAGPQS